MGNKKSGIEVKSEPGKSRLLIEDSERERWRRRPNAPIAKRGRPRKGQTYSVFFGDPDLFFFDGNERWAQ
jgi:hypothetical protein